MKIKMKRFVKVNKSNFFKIDDNNDSFLVRVSFEINVSQKLFLLLPNRDNDFNCWTIKN